MIRHTIMFKVKPGLSEQTITSACADFLALKSKLPGILTAMGGKCNLHEGKGEDIFTHAFSLDFKNQEALDRFFNDPITHPAKEGIVNIADGGYEGLIGFDLKG